MQEPSAAIIKAWGRLIRAERTVVGRIEAELKGAGFPSLRWYDVLLELKRGPEGRLTPGEIEEAVLFEQYNLSRLLDRPWPTTHRCQSLRHRANPLCRGEGR